jgi:hypothetical protein
VVRAVGRDSRNSSKLVAAWVRRTLLLWVRRTLLLLVGSRHTRVWADFLPYAAGGPHDTIAPLVRPLDATTNIARAPIRPVRQREERLPFKVQVSNEFAGFVPEAVKLPCAPT